MIKEPLIKNEELLYINVIKGAKVDPIAIRPRFYTTINSSSISHSYIEWQTREPVTRTIEITNKIFNKEENKVQVTTSKDNVYEFQPLSLELYNRFVKPITAGQPEFETQEGLKKFFLKQNFGKLT